MAFGFGKWDLTVDVVAVGSGLGGIGAAIVAHDAGKKAVIFEKAPKLGGVCGYSGGEVFVPKNHLHEAAGIRDSREAGLDYFQFLAAGYADPALQAILLDTGPVAGRDLEDRAGGGGEVKKKIPHKP